MDFKRILLNNAAFLEEELELSPVLDFFVDLHKITPEERDRINSESSRRARVRLFMSEVIARCDSSTYHFFKLSLQDQNRQILLRLEKNESPNGLYISKLLVSHTIPLLV